MRKSHGVNSVDPSSAELSMGTKGLEFNTCSIWFKTVLCSLNVRICDPIVLRRRVFMQCTADSHNPPKCG